MATRNGLWRERFPGGLAAAAGAVSPRAPLAELVSRTTQPRRGSDPRELFRRHLSGLSGQSALYQAGEAQREDFDALASAHPRGARAPPSRTSHFSLSAALWLAGRHRRHDFRRDSQSWAAPGALSWSAKDAAASPGHRGSHQLSPHP